MRQLALSSLFLLLLLPSSALAAGWHHVGGRAEGFSLSYPMRWNVSATTEPGNARQVMLSYQGKQVYALTVTILRLKTGASLRQTVAQFRRYERAQGNVALAQVRWSPTSLARHAAVSGVMRPQTEGGVGQAQGIFLAPWRGKVYQITIVSFGRTAPNSIGRFPAIYRHILATWRFL